MTPDGCHGYLIAPFCKGGWGDLCCFGMKMRQNRKSTRHKSQDTSHKTPSFVAPKGATAKYGSAGRQVFGISPEENRYESENIENREILVIGCGNVLLGDDGLGPAFIKYFSKKYAADKSVRTIKRKNNIGIIDAGTSIRTILFNLVLSDKKPKRIIIIDAVDKGKKPGEIFEIPLEDIPPLKSDDFSMHQLPTSNLLKELRDECKIKVEVLAVQVQSIPDKIKCGLSEPVAKSIPKLYNVIIKIAKKRF